MKLRIPLLVVAFASVATSAFAITGCAVHEDREPVEYAEADPVIDVRLYPHEYYEGRDVYWVHDRWYYRNGGRWAYYRSEPGELGRRRAHYAPVHEERHDEHVREEHHEEHHEEHEDHGHDHR